MSAHRNVNKLVVVKKLTDLSYNVDNIIRIDLEPNNKGFLAILVDGRVVLTTWIKKKVSSKVITDASDGCWQCGSESEVVVTCQNGSLVRYSVHFDTGLSCSLQLSAPSLLSLIRERDSTIRSSKNLKAWGHSSQHLLLQPQSDRLVILATNAGGRPSTHGVLRTPPLRSAHLYGNTVLAQPVTGSSLYEYDVTKCKVMGVVVLGVQRASSEYTEWGSLACSTTGDTVALTDSERHLYLTNFKQRTPLPKKSGVSRCKVTLHQIIWPASIEPGDITELSLALSDTTLALFCRTSHQNQGIHHYLSYDVGVSNLNCHHVFSEAAAIIPGTTHLLPDLFLTQDGVAMLMDEDASISSLDSDIDLGELLGGLREELNMAKVTEVKAMVEQGLSVFLSSCNQLEGWVGLAGSRAQQYGQLADILLSYTARYAQKDDTRSFALSLKFLATHHFSIILDEMSNVLKYVDDDSISQMILQMSEQVSFYLKSVEKLQLPQAGTAADMAQLSEDWGDRPLKEIVEDALRRNCLKSVETYLQLKPWVYGAVNTPTILATCLDIAREQTSPQDQQDIIRGIDDRYRGSLKQVLYVSDDQFEVWVLGRALGDHLTPLESRAIQVVSAIHRTLPDLLTLPPQRWVELVRLGDIGSGPITAPITVAQVASWTPLAMMLVLCDLYAYSADADIVANIDGDVMWQYLLHQNDLRNLKRWIFKDICHQQKALSEDESSQNETMSWLDPSSKLSKRLQGKDSDKHFGSVEKEKDWMLESKFGALNFLTEPLYASDVESSVKSHDSLDSSSIAPSEADTYSVRSFEMYDSRECLWHQDLFQPITQGMIDLVVIAKVPFAELVLNILARCGVFTTKEKTEADLLTRRLCMSGALELLPHFNGDHPCKLSSTDVHKILMKFFTKQDLALPAYNYIKDYSLDSKENNVLEELATPLWIKVIVPFMHLQKSKDKQSLYKASVENLTVLSETCKSPKELLLPAFLTMLFAPGMNLTDFVNHKCKMGYEGDQFLSECKKKKKKEDEDGKKIRREKGERDGEDEKEVRCKEGKSDVGDDSRKEVDFESDDGDDGKKKKKFEGGERDDDDEKEHCTEGKSDSGDDVRKEVHFESGGGDDGRKDVHFESDRKVVHFEGDDDLHAVCSILRRHQVSPRQVIAGVVECLPHLQALCGAQTRTDLDVTLYDLLLPCISFDLTRLFTFQQNNRHGYDERGEIPSWSSEELVSRHGILHSLHHRYFLSEARPTYATATLLTPSHTFTPKRLSEFSGSVCGVGLSSWPDRGVSAACLATLLMSGMDTDRLRTVLSSAYLIYNVQSSWCSKLSEERRKGHESVMKTEMSRVLQQLCVVENRTQAAVTLLDMLENCVILSLVGKVSATKGRPGHNELLGMGLPLTNVVDMMGVVFPGRVSQKDVYTLLDGLGLCVALADIYNLSCPLRILTKLAESDQWLLFLVAIQVFKYPKLEVLKVAESFRSTALREHVTLALTHICYYRDAHESRERGRVLAHSKRSSLYAKIGISNRDSSRSPVNSGDDGSRSTSPSEFEMSVLDDALSFTTTDTSVDSGVDAWLTYESKDLYSILLACHQLDNPATELCIAAVTLSSPVLTVFSACYDGYSPQVCLAGWLYTQLSHKSKLSLHKQLATCEAHQVASSVKLDQGKSKSPRKNCCRSCDIAVLQSGVKELEWFILSHVLEGSLNVVAEGLRIYDLYSPLLSIILAIQEIKGMCNLDKVTTLLTSSATSTNKQETNVESEWMTMLVLNIIGTALDHFIINSHLQHQFLTVLTAVSQLPPFSSHFVNWNLVGQICNIVKIAKHKVKFLEILLSFETGELKDKAEKVVKELSNKQCFSEALQICQLLDIPLFTIVSGQLKAEFKNNNQILTNISLLDDFLSRGHKQLSEKDVPPELAVELYMNVFEEVAEFCGKYHCLQYALLWAYKCSATAELGNIANLESFVFPARLEGEQLVTKLEYMMWQTYLQACCNRETDSSQLAIDLPQELGSWPWEKDETSCLDLSLVVKNAALEDYPLLPVKPSSPLAQVKESIDAACNKESNSTLDKAKNAKRDSNIDNASSKEGTSTLDKAKNIKRDNNKMNLAQSQVSVEDVKRDNDTKIALSQVRVSDNEKAPTHRDSTATQRKDKPGDPAADDDKTLKGAHSKPKQETDWLRHRALQKLVNLCADKGLLVTGCRILRLFEEKNKNVESLLLLLSLAEGGKTTVGDRESVAETSPSRHSTPRRRSTSCCTVHSSTSGFSILSFDDYVGAQAAQLTKVTAGLTAGRKLGERVLILYKVATTLDLCYLYLIHHPNPITLVSLVVRSRKGGVMQLARDLIQALPIPQTALQNFLFEEAVATITAGPESGGRSGQCERLLGWDDLEAGWVDLVGLVQDPSHLGHQLLEFGHRLGSSSPDQAQKVHQMTVELVVRAHDCFTVASNMEGIGTVLRTALPLSTSLLNHAQWSLMVRLLVGVGRYSEMSYIIDALREHDQFEPLLGRGLALDGSGGRGARGLDRALVHYLRSKYPDDTETLRLVALHFLLYSEVAEMWGSEAEGVVERVLEATVDLAMSCNTSPTLSSPGTGPSSSSKVNQRDTPPNKPASRRSSPTKGVGNVLSGGEGEFEPQYLVNPDLKLLTQAMHNYAHAAQYYMQDQQFALAVEYSQEAELVALQIAQVKKCLPGPALRLLKLTPAGVKYVTTRSLRVAEAQVMSRAYQTSVDWGSALYHQYVKMGQESYLAEYLATFRLSPQILLQIVNKLEHDGVTREGRSRVGSLLPHMEEAELVYRVGSQLGLKAGVDSCLTSPAAPYLRDTVFVRGCTSSHILP